MTSIITGTKLSLRDHLFDWAVLRREGYFAWPPKRLSPPSQAREMAMLRHQLHHDETTGLPNRLFLRERLGQALSGPEAKRNFAILVVDLDRFKPVNELYGKAAGDVLLRDAALRIQALLDEKDHACRLGGDKFAILHHLHTQPESEAGLAERLVRTFREPFRVQGQAVVVGASVGIRLYQPEGGLAETLLQDADTALQDARAQGGGTYCLFEAEMRRRQEAKWQMEQDFRNAIEFEQFVVHYQPLFDCNHISLSGFEALVRWQHPVHGIVGPARFIPFAERSGLIIRLGLWVIETACTQAASWPDHLRIAVNISPLQLRAADLAERIAATLQKTGLSARRLELEVTEGALIENPEQACSILHRLKAMGVRIAIDDFGTGYSSLSYLRHFPFDRIKIDRSFVQDLEPESDALLIVRTIIDLGHSLRVGVLAEGIETEAQLRLLREQSCDQVQGYLLGRPVPIAGAAEMVRAALRSPAQSMGLE